MKHLRNSSTRLKSPHIWPSFMIALIAVLFFVSGTQLMAQDGAGDFVSATYASASGDSVINANEITLSGDDLATTGTLDGLVATANGLALADGATSGTYTSDPIAAPSPATDIAPLWKVSAPEGTTVSVETRLSLDGGPYSDWLPNPEVFFPVRDEQAAGNLILLGGPQATIQVRFTLTSQQAGLSPTLTSLSLIFSDTSDGPSDAAIAGQASALAYAANTCPVPRPANIVSRTAWGSPDGQGSRAPVSYQSVTNVVVHHTATANTAYQDYASMVRTIWNFHTNVLGWGDVGYNYLIDPNGVIYEGRAGGDDAIGVRGVNRGPNAGAMAVGFIGCYGNCNYLGLNNAQPSQAMLNSGVELMAWKLGQKNLDPNGSSVLGGIANVPTIAGGRDVSSTFSPGDNLYAQMPTFRTRVDDRLNCPQACQITDIVFDKNAYNVNDTINVTLRLADQQDNPLDNANVRVDVDRPVAGVNAASIIDLDTEAGLYEGSYSNTDLAGTYLFRFSATDPNNARFTPCYGEVPISVQGVATPTPTPGTPTPPPTPVPNPIVRVEPGNLEAYLCDSFETSSAISVVDAPRLGTVRLEISYDPNIVQIRDANAERLGVQIRPNQAFVESPSFITRNEVDTDAGKIIFEATLLGDKVIEGDDTLITIDWFPQNPGETAITIDVATFTNANDTPVTFESRNGTVLINNGCLPVNGVATLEGRTDYSGVVVTNADGEQSTTAADGSFTINGVMPLSFSFDGYLPAEANRSVAQPVTSSADGTVEMATVGQITLLAGDMNADQTIDIFDLAYLASSMDTSDALADLNADGTVDILDLVLVASNYRQSGPLTAWE